MILAWYAFTILAGVCIMFTLAHIIGGWVEWREDKREMEEIADFRVEWVAAREARSAAGAAGGVALAECEAVAAAAWKGWGSDETRTG